MKRFFLSLFALMLISLSAFAETEADLFTLESSIDWSKRQIVVNVALDLKKASIKMPGGRSEAELLIETSLGSVLNAVFLALNVDSRNTINESLINGDITQDNLKDILKNAEISNRHFSNDFAAFKETFTFSLSAFETLFIKHSIPKTAMRSLESVPSKDYSGIVIYAKGKLPIHGVSAEAFLEPCLFPRIYDSRMNLLLDKNAIRPDYLRTWGSCAYSSSEKSVDYEERAGGSPLIIMSEGVFGIKHTDLIIQYEDALKIVSSQKNRKLLEEGRVVIIIDEASSKEALK